MLKAIVLILITGVTMAADRLDLIKKEIMDTEQAFNEMVSEEGIKKGFLHYAAKDAVIMRGDKVYEGIAEIEKYLDANPVEFKTFIWKPDFIDVAESGEMAYTYGKYHYEIVDQEGKLKTGGGIFHTVWKKQFDGSWKYVWD